MAHGTSRATGSSLGRPSLFAVSSGVTKSCTIVGVVLYVVNTIIPMDARVKTIVNAIAIIAVCLWVLSELSVLPRGTVHLR